jgi:hypothetical protein
MRARRINAVTKWLFPLTLTLTLGACGGAHSAKSTPLISLRHGVLPLQWVDTHGIQVAVPSSWKLNRGICGTPQANTVLWNEDGTTLCLPSEPKGLNVVEFNSVPREPPGWYRRHTKPVTIDGVRARRWDAGTVQGSHEVQLAVSGRNISLTVLSPDPGLIHRILASVRTVRVDPYGCPTNPMSVFRRGSEQSVSPLFVPAGARAMVGCSYQGRWLDHANLIGREAAGRLARALDAAPHGFSHAPRHTILPSICGSTWRNSLIVTRFEYVGRPSVSVAAHLDGCSHLGASNGRWGVRLRPQWVSPMISDARYSGATPDLSKYR